jgi:T-complex protein 1 subunit delta
VQLVQLSKAQDVEAGDGTTSVVVLAGSLLDACERLLSKGIHPAAISAAFGKASQKACQILEEVSACRVVSQRDSVSMARAGPSASLTPYLCPTLPR